MPRLRQSIAVLMQVLILISYPLSLPAASKSKGEKLVRAEDMKGWLSVLSSDEYEGRNTFTEGLGLSAAYIAGELKALGVRPGGDKGSYFQRVPVLGVKASNKATITVEANGQSKTFNNGEAFSLPVNMGGKRSFTSDQIEFLGYGLEAPMAKINDYAGKDVKGKVVVFIGTNGPKALDNTYRRTLFGRGRSAIEQHGAVAAIGPAFARPPSGGGGAAAAPAAPPRGGGMFGPPIEKEDFTTVQRLDVPLPPSATAQDEFFEFLFGGQDVPYSQLKSKAADRDTLPSFALKNVKITFNLDVEYRVVRTQFTRNVVGIVEGKDPQLKKTYVAFGAHYDHVGYSEGEVIQTPGNPPRRAEPRGRVKEGAVDDRIWNGADDDGTGSVTVLALAKAFARGPKPRRSLIFVWHTGEEKGLFGSRYFADYPTVPMESIVAQINMDMIGRNQNDKAEEGDTVYLIGSDRISTELHNLTLNVNRKLPQPLKLDFAYNDPSDSEQLYFRSDHYSYAAKGVPVVFLTTGLHPDYHFNTDSIEKINFPKMTRIAVLCYELGVRLADLDHAPARDNLGPRVGKGSDGVIK